VGSSHEDRVRVLSAALQRTNPVKDRRSFDAIFDSYIICLAYDSRFAERIASVELNTARHAACVVGDHGYYLPRRPLPEG